jgi:IMP dehydrogenase
MKFKTFDDVLIVPKFSAVKSRKDVDISTWVGGTKLSLPIYSANMDSITGTKMAVAMAHAGGLGVLHRFSTPEENLKDYLEVCQFNGCPVAVSVGLGDEELRRAEVFMEYGAPVFFIDVAHGAQISVAEQFNKLRKLNPKCEVIVGNFASPGSIGDFISKLDSVPTAVKIGIGPGSACTTRIKTGVGVPQLSAIQWCNKLYNGVDIPLIADGGMKTPGDIAKALAAGADAVMLGGMLAGTSETPGQEIYTDSGIMKRYRGSASTSSYKDQNKTSDWRTDEGVEFYVKSKGPVSNVLKDIEGGLRSAFTYVGFYS